MRNQDETRSPACGRLTTANLQMGGVVAGWLPGQRHARGGGVSWNGGGAMQPSNLSTGVTVPEIKA